jgi:pyruvate/2-oxoglutarate dehydrogenase complex dihydrolipoamide dehydrogenase (E3) component
MDGRTDGLCKLIFDSKTLKLLGAHVLGSYSAEVIQVAATCMAAGMTVNKIAELELAFPTFTEAIGIAARRICRKLRLETAEWVGDGGSD